MEAFVLLFSIAEPEPSLLWLQAVASRRCAISRAQLYNRIQEGVL
jgi:hypothetical protein